MAMDFDLDQVQELFNSLSPDDLANLQAAASSMFGSAQAPPPDDDDAAFADDCPPDAFGDAPTGGFGFDPAMLAQLLHMMQNMNRNDPSSDLIRALKPHLSARRQQRADQALQMMQLFSALSMFRSL